MSKVIFKMKFQHPKLAKTQKNNANHLIYIGTREGVALNEDLQQVEGINSENTEYVKYMSNRPRSHGLFTKSGTECNLGKLVDEMKDYKGYVYRGIVSLREQDAIEKGYDSKEKWELLIRGQMLNISKQMGIPYTQLKWVGAFHRESGHPHVHLMIWDSQPEHHQVNINRQGVIPKKNLENIRKQLTNEIFKEERENILTRKDMLREFLIEGAKGSQTGDFSKLEDIEEKFAEIDSEILSEAEEINLYNIGDRIRNQQIEDIKKMIQDLEVPEKGRLQYKLMPLEIKKQIDSITDKILDNPSYRRYFNKYMGTIEELTKLYTDKGEDIEKAKDNARDDIYSRIGNTILKTKKEIITSEKREQYNKNSENFYVQNMLMNVVKILSSNTNQKQNMKDHFSKSKAQRKEIAKKLRVTGLYTDGEI